jgi:hypothetical protein
MSGGNVEGTESENSRFGSSLSLPLLAVSAASLSLAPCLPPLCQAPQRHMLSRLLYVCAEADVAIFHISLWSSVFLIGATCYGACMLSYMDTGDDSIFNIDISDAVKKAN